MNRMLIPFIQISILLWSIPQVGMAQRLIPMAEVKPQQALPLKIIDIKQFCHRMKADFSTYGKQSGYDAVQTAMLANAATSALIQEFRDGRGTDYINAQALARFASLPPKGKEGYLPVSHFMGRAMGINREITLALSVGELRFIPFAAKGMELVVVARNTAALTPARAKKVAEVARKSRIKINVVWLGEADRRELQIEEARTLAWLAASTGGAFANLSGNGIPCSQAL